MSNNLMIMNMARDILLKSGVNIFDINNHLFPSDVQLISVCVIAVMSVRFKNRLGKKPLTYKQRLKLKKKANFRHPIAVVDLVGVLRKFINSGTVIAAALLMFFSHHVNLNISLGNNLFWLNIWSRVLYLRVSNILIHIGSALR